MPSEAPPRADGPAASSEDNESLLERLNNLDLNAPTPPESDWDTVETSQVSTQTQNENIRNESPNPADPPAAITAINERPAASAEAPAPPSTSISLEDILAEFLADARDLGPPPSSPRPAQAQLPAPLPSPPRNSIPDRPAFPRTRSLTYAAFLAAHPEMSARIPFPERGRFRHFDSTFAPRYRAANNAGRMRIATEDNVMDRFELFLLGDGEKKVTEEADTREL